MKLETFKKLINEPKRTKEELEQMMRNAISKGNLEFASIAKGTLNLRFPGWDIVASRHGGAKPTLAKFHNAEHVFTSSKEAYTWLINRIIEVHPEPFVNVNWETEFISEGVRRLYFAKDLNKMFFGTQHLAEDQNNYRLLPNGWYANMNLDNDRKFNILCKMAAVAKLEFNSDWFWQVLP